MRHCFCYHDTFVSKKMSLLLKKVSINPLTASAVYIRFLHFLLAHYVSAFKHIKDKK